MFVSVYMTSDTFDEYTYDIDSSSLLLITVKSVAVMLFEKHLLLL